jgi:hypothetical protein
MLDVEFVAELTIGFLHGPQNKKLTLEKWFETYETSFPDKDKVSAMFPKVLGEMTQTVSDFPKTRWRKKSDFYSLFLLFASHETALPLSKTARKEASRLLHRFADVVDKYLAQRGSAPKLITEYAEAVERAASDLGNRKALQRSPELTRGRSPEVDHPEFPPMTRASADAHEASLPHLPSLVCAGPPCWPSAARVFGVGLSDRSSRADASVVAST